MRTSLGISAGNEVVCSALVATAPNGAQDFDYRVVSADVAHSDLGDLVASSIELMTTPMPRDYLHPLGAHAVRPASAPPEPVTAPGAIAVAYRDREQAVAIRSAIGRQRRDVQLIPESTAALTYLSHTGLLDRYETVALIDLGACGMTVTVAAPADETVLHSERTNAISGNAVDELIYHHLLDCHFARRGTRPNRTMLINRSRAAKEHLSIAPAVTIDHVAGQPLKLTRADFQELIADLLREAAVFAAAVFARAPKYPDAITLIGGGANMTAVVDGLAALLDVPVFSVPEPEAVTAKGAALVADSAQPSAFPVISIGSDASPSTFAKVVGTLAGAVVVVGLVVGYGVRELAPTVNHDISPAGTSRSAEFTPSAPPSAGTPATTTADQTQPGRHTAATTAPTTTTPDFPQPTTPADTPTTTGVPLRPDPNLPQIPLPDLPKLFGPLLGTSTVPPTIPNSTPSRGQIMPRANSGSAGTEPTLEPAD
ncbi:Hsp70 family protein [Nocardia sp. NEAU-G5]|uniref:Hsp70 family protein n=1 Tax=Nocardia albiluteola TaxID=2842303 RepID=A0ABS6AU80_9NOCA|nr:Hsp70 family protein [Nocardia albiluteola]MBU3061567.1 Hsp70 family protein [Nocardia albiluteola]